MSQPEFLYFPPSPPSSVKMDSATTDGSCNNPSSPPTRSTVGSQVSVTGEFVLGSNITASPHAHTLELSHQPPVSSPEDYSSTSYLNTPTSDSCYLPTSTSQSYPRFASLSSPALDSLWDQPGQAQEGSRLSLHSQQDHQQLTSTSRQTGRSGSMRYYFSSIFSIGQTLILFFSTVAIQFDPVFSMGPRSAFTWPGTQHSPFSINTTN